MIVEAAARLHSFADAAYALSLANILISSRHVQRISVEIGLELVRERDRKVLQHRRGQLPIRVSGIPEVVAVEIDGGRLRTRAVGMGKGVHKKQNKEDKIACLVTLKSKVSQDDPQPEPPQSFLQPRRVQRLVQKMQGKSASMPQDEAAQGDAAEPRRAKKAAPQGKAAPKKLVRTCVASMTSSGKFGSMVAAEAQERGFYQAKRRAFVADGAAYNWEIQQGYFRDFVAIADFLHVLCHIYLAAWGVGKNDEQRWMRYKGWMRECWKGGVKKVIEELTAWQRLLGKPEKRKKSDRKDPRVLVAEALTYLTNNQERMDYPRFRKEGLPVTSSLAESLVGQFNDRVKGSEKFWNRGKEAEAILQLCAANLSEDDRLQRFFSQRPGFPFRRRD